MFASMAVSVGNVAIDCMLENDRIGKPLNHMIRIRCVEGKCKRLGNVSDMRRTERETVTVRRLRLVIRVLDLPQEFLKNIEPHQKIFFFEIIAIRRALT